MDVTEVELPGVGLRYEFDLAQGGRIGVIARRGGGFEIALYSQEDPDEARPLFRLQEEEAEALVRRRRIPDRDFRRHDIREEADPEPAIGG